MDHGLKGHLHNYCTQFPMSCTLWHILLMKRRQRSDHIFHLWFLSFSEIAGALIMWERRRGVLIMWKWAIVSDEKSILDHKLQLCEQQQEKRSGKYSLWGGRECAQTMNNHHCGENLRLTVPDWLLLQVLESQYCAPENLFIQKHQKLTKLITGRCCCKRLLTYHQSLDLGLLGD